MKRLATMPGVPAIILSGGRSRRMGRDKALLPLGSETVLHRVFRAFATIADSTILVIGKQSEPPVDAGFDRVVRDEHADRGPLEGLRVGLRAVGDSEFAMVGTCDAPLIVPEVYTRMLSRLSNSKSTDAVVPTVDGQVYPLTAVYRSRVLSEIESMMEAGKLRVKDLLQRIAVDEMTKGDMIDCDPNLDTLRNINTAGDYQWLQQYVK